MKYFSEYQEDAFIFENIGVPAKGFYLDIGCASPLTGSNTAFLRQLGWSGLGIDANPGWADRWQDAGCLHSFVCGVVSRFASVKFAFNPVPGLSRVGEGINYATTTIDRLLEGLPTPDFLSLDVEGHEYDALLSMDITKHRPLIIVSEYSTAVEGGEPQLDFRVRDYLLANGYREVHHTQANIIFLRT